MAVPRQRIRLPNATWRRAIAAAVRGELWDGPDIARFERSFAALIGVPDAITVPSGRAGLRFLIDGLELEPGAEVICSAFGYPVVPYLVKALGYRLRFVDCEMQTLGMDPAALANAITDETRAVIATHLYGVPCRIDEIADIAREHGAALIEDCAHCCGAAVGDRKAGAFGAGAYFSFETSKVINTLGGGMVTVSDPALAARVRAARDGEPRNGWSWLARRLIKTSFEATVTHPLVFNLGVYQALRLAQRGTDGDDRFASGYHGDEVSLAGKMGRYTNFQARLGLAQLSRIEERNTRRTAYAETLIEGLRGRLLFQEPAGPEVTPNYMLVTALTPDGSALAGRLLRAGVDTKRLYMRDCSGLFDSGEIFANAARAEVEALHIPAFPELPPNRIEWLVETIRDVAGSTPAGTNPPGLKTRDARSGARLD